jgi:predicted DNA-binding transcriptional regulator AlpA
MQTQTSNIKEWLSQLIREAIFEAISKYFKPQSEIEEFLTAKESAAFIGDKMPTFYRRISEGEIPTCGGGKRINCRKSDLIKWLNQDRTYSKAQLKEDAITKMTERRRP